MINTNFVALNRQQFALLREAKRLVNVEFDQNLELQSDTVLEELYQFALQSSSQQLFNIFSQLKEELNPGSSMEEGSATNGLETGANSSADNKEKPKKPRGFYRGVPIED